MMPHLPRSGGYRGSLVLGPGWPVAHSYLSLLGALYHVGYCYLGWHLLGVLPSQCFEALSDWVEPCCECA